MLPCDLQLSTYRSLCPHVPFYASGPHPMILTQLSDPQELRPTEGRRWLATARNKHAGGLALYGGLRQHRKLATQKTTHTSRKPL